MFDTLKLKIYKNFDIVESSIIITSVILFILALVLAEINEFKEMDSKKMFILIPGVYTIWVNANNEKLSHPPKVFECKQSIKQNGDKFQKCFKIEIDRGSYFNNNSFDHAKGQFYKYKIFHIEEIGYYEFDILFKPKTYFLRSGWEKLHWLITIPIGFCWIMIYGWIRSPFNKSK